MILIQALLGVYNEFGYRTGSLGGVPLTGEEYAMKRNLTGIVVICFLLTACNAPTAQPTATLVFPTAPQSPTETLSAATSEVTTPEPGATEEAAQTLVLEAFSASVGVQVINLRAGPGTAFDVLGKYAKDAPLAVLGKSLGDEWLLVETPAGQLGWMTAIFIIMDTPIETLPIIPTAFSVMVTGTIKDNNDAPVDKVNVAVYQQTVYGELRSDAATDASGAFYVFLPNGSQGVFSVSIVGVDCTSSIMDDNCKYQGTFDANGIAEITLPSNEAISFTYRP